MVIVNPTGEQEYYMDGYEKTVYDTAKKVVTKDWDFVFLIDGTEGGGKSVKAQQGATYCDPSFPRDCSRIAYNPDEFQDLITKASKYQAVIYDEAYTGLSSRGVMSDINKTLVSMLAEIRQKNLFVFIVMPTFFDLDRYPALWRSRGLFHVYTGDDFSRGFFAFYNVDRKKQLYILGKKFYSYNQPKPNFIGRFTNKYTVDEETYRKRKLDALGNYKRKTVAQLKDELRFPIALKALCKHVSTYRAAEELAGLGLELTARRISQIVNDSPDDKL